MLFPNISTYPEPQQEAIERARKTGYSSFSQEDISYTLKRDVRGFRIDAISRSGYSAGHIFTDARSDHYGLKVEQEFHSQGIGQLLFRTKQALDGILPQDWTGKYSKMFFLIKFGYMPIARIFDVCNPTSDQPLNQHESRVLLEDLHFYTKNKKNLPDWFGACPFLTRMLYAPQGARALFARLQSDSLVF